MSIRTRSVTLKGRRGRTRAARAAALVVASVIAVVALTTVGASASEQSAFALPRNQTFYMSGSQWAPYGDVNPAKTWDYSTGTVGLAFETAFRFNPLTGNFIPWLATGGTWQSKTVYVMNIRTGVKFSDGSAMTARDVKYSFDLPKIATHPQNALWASTGLQSTRAAGNKVIFTFAGKPGYQQFDFYRYNVAIVPRQVFSKFSKTELTTGNLSPAAVVGTGPYTYESGASPSAQTFVWKRKDSWWATKALGLKPAPKYVVDIHNSSNAAAFANFQAGNVDLFNNFAPKSAISGSAKTFYSKAPYHLGANTTWLFPNTTKKPLNDPAFRRALATSVNMNQILAKAYQGLVQKASPTGLLPIWNKWVDKKAVAKYGFSYNASQGESDPRRSRLQGHGRGRVRREQGRLGHLAHDPVPERLVRLDDVDPGHRRQCEGRRHQDHPRLPGLRDDGRRSRPREVRPAPRERPAVLEYTVDVLPVHLPAADPRQPDDGQLREVLEREGLEPHAVAGQDLHEQSQGVPGCDDAAADALHEEPPCNSALVQRNVGDVQHEVLDELAIVDGRAVHADGLEQLLADDEHRHAHPSEAREVAELNR